MAFVLMLANKNIPRWAQFIMAVFVSAFSFAEFF